MYQLQFSFAIFLRGATHLMHRMFNVSLYEVSHWPTRLCRLTSACMVRQHEDFCNPTQLIYINHQDAPSSRKLRTTSFMSQRYNMALEFLYHPLTSPDSIRLIELQPSRDLAASIQYRLIHTSFSSNSMQDIFGHYTALSYLWACADKVKTI